MSALQPGRSLRAAARAALLAAALAAAGCGDPAATADPTPAPPSAAAPAKATGAAVDPALNWGGTTPHDTPPQPNPLMASAEAILRKAEPGFDRFETTYLIGDLDRDGRDDVAVEYGIGEEGATRQAAKSIRVLLARDGGLQLQPDQTSRFEHCPALREIRDGELWADGLEACLLPFPRTLAYYRFQWRDGGLQRVAKEDVVERSRARLRALRDALRGGGAGAADARLRPGPQMDGAPDPIFAEASARRGFADAIDALSGPPLEKVTQTEGHSWSLQRPGPYRGERSLQIDPAPQDATAEIAGAVRAVDARVSVSWPQSEGIGYFTTWRLIEGDLYLESAEQVDTESTGH